MRKPETIDSPFKRAAHALVDELPPSATWNDLAERVRFEMELAEAATETERAFAPVNGTRQRPSSSGG